MNLNLKKNNYDKKNSVLFYLSSNTFDNELYAYCLQCFVQ